MKEYNQRQEAIKRFIQGEKVATIARLMGKSRKWLHHWIKRFKDSSDSAKNWYEDESKAPKKVNTKLEPETERQILLICNDLVNEKMAQSEQYQFSMNVNIGVLNRRLPSGQSTV